MASIIGWWSNRRCDTGSHRQFLLYDHTSWKVIKRNIFKISEVPTEKVVSFTKDRVSKIFRGVKFRGQFRGESGGPI